MRCNPKLMTDIDSRCSSQSFHMMLPAAAMRLLPIALFLLLVGCDAGKSPSTGTATGTAKAARPAWLLPAMVDSVRLAMEQGERTGDVPVGACVVVGTGAGRIITTGHNTTLSEGNAAGHAEINALTKAIAAVGGAKNFSAIPRDSIFLITSFEPCPMCAGAIALWNIPPSQVAVFLPKLPEWKTPELQAVQRLRDGWVLTGDDTLQIEFFCRHASFREAFPHKCR